MLQSFYLLQSYARYMANESLQGRHVSVRPCTDALASLWPSLDAEEQMAQRTVHFLQGVHFKCAHVCVSPRQPQPQLF